MTFCCTHRGMSLILVSCRSSIPLLTRIEDFDESPILVIRPLQRADPLFDRVRDTSLPFADPVETALDLCDLGLTAQAGQLFAHFRPEARLA